MTAIRAVVFDIGGVLEIVDDAAWPATWMARWEARAGFATGHVAAALACRGPIGNAATGGVSEAWFREFYAETLHLDRESADAMMAEMWDAYCGRMDRRLAEFVAELRAQFRTAILSNSADGARREEQRRYGFDRLVDDIVYSHEVGLAKPDQAIFALTEVRLGVRPEEIVFLDDHAPHVEAARVRGWHAVHHRDTPASIREIRAIIANTRRV